MKKQKSRNKKRQVTYIAPLQPFTLAAFLPWGDSIGAGRIRLADANVRERNIEPRFFGFYEI